MEKNISLSSNINKVDIVIKAQEGAIVFEIKDPKQLNKALLNEIKEDLFSLQKDTFVLYPEQRIIDTQGVFLENSALLIC